MKKGLEMGLTPIKCQNRQGTEELKTLHYEVNELIYRYSKRYISPMVAKRLIERFTEIGVALNEIDYEPAKPKAKEIQSALRDIIHNLKHYIKGYKWTEDDKGQIQATINYFVRETVQAKKDGKLEQDLIDTLQEQKEIYEGMVVSSNLKGLNLSAFMDFNNELLALFERKYKISLK